jgi:hypothetical protein
MVFAMPYIFIVVNGRWKWYNQINQLKFVAKHVYVFWQFIILGGFIMQIEYVESEKMIVQGKSHEIHKRYGGEWNIKELGRGNGNWLLTQKSDVLVDGESYRGFVLEYYGESRLTKELADKFREDIESGKVKLQ